MLSNERIKIHHLNCLRFVFGMLSFFSHLRKLSDMNIDEAKVAVSSLIRGQME